MVSISSRSSAKAYGSSSTVLGSRYCLALTVGILLVLLGIRDSYWPQQQSYMMMSVSNVVSEASSVGDENSRTRRSPAAPPLLYDSSTATVMGMARGYGKAYHRRFVGTLRKSGYKGHISK